MTEGRLKEIKDCIDLQRAYPILHDDGHLIEQKLELYNEVVRLREIINKANLFVETYLNNVDDIDVNMEVVKDILKQNNLTLEQLTGVDNE